VPKENQHPRCRGVLECNWVRLVTVWPQYTPQVNLVATLTQPDNAITFTAIRAIPAEAELVAYLLTPNPAPSPIMGHASYPRSLGGTLHLPGHQGTREALVPNVDLLTGPSQLLVATTKLRKALKAIMEDEPLDLSQSLMANPLRTVLDSADERRSVSSESSVSSSSTHSDTSSLASYTE
ncbi:unnamed protein product, partial [Meganyctiphanes norvegica]